MPGLSREGKGLWLGVIVLLVLCAMATAWFPLASITALPAVGYNEGWNAYRQWITLQHQQLYGSAPGLWTTNYPFLSFHIIGLLGGAKDHLVLAGRIVCFAALVAVSVLAGGIVRGATGSRLGAVYAGLCLFAGLGAFNGAGRAVNDPELLSAAFAMFGLFAYLRSPRSAWYAAAAVAFSVSLFTKHDQLAFPISAGLHLLITRNFRAFAVFTAAGIVTCSLLMALSCHLDGPYFFAAFLQPRAYGLVNLRSETLHYLLHFAPFLVLAAMLLWRDTYVPHRGFLTILLILTNAMSIGFAGGDGVAANIFYPALIADILACVIALSWQYSHGRHFRASLIISALSVVLMVPAQISNDIAAWGRLPAATVAAQQAVNFLKSTNGPAICEDLLLCYAAGKPLDFDPYYVRDQILIGRLREQDLTALLTAHHYAAIQIDASSLAQRKDARFTPAFLQILQAQYRRALAGPRFSIFVPRS